MIGAAFLDRPLIQFAKMSGAFDASDLTTYTFAGLDFGAAHPDRKLFAAVTIRAAGTPSISSITIGGVTATSLALSTNTDGGNRTHAAIMGAAVPTGTSGDLVVTLSGSGAVRCGYTLYRAVGPALTALDPKTSTSGSPSGTLTIPPRGFGIACGYAGNTTVTGAAWTGLTEDTDVLDAGNGHSSASLSSYAGASSLAVTLTWTGGTATPAFAMAAFGY